MEDLYSILNVSKNTSQEEIKRAYRKLAVKHHPDKKKDKDDTKFKEIATAYSILSNNDKRSRYDNGESFESINSAQNSHDEMRKELINLLVQCIQQNDVVYTDLVESMRLELAGVIGSSNHIIERINKHITELKEVSDRFSGKDNFFNVAVDSQVEKLNQEITAQKDRIDLAERAREELTNYKYRADERPKPQNNHTATFSAEAEFAEEFIKRFSK